MSMFENEFHIPEHQAKTLAHALEIRHRVTTFSEGMLQIIESLKKAMNEEQWVLQNEAQKECEELRGTISSLGWDLNRKDEEIRKEKEETRKEKAKCQSLTEDLYKITMQMNQYRTCLLTKAAHDIAGWFWEQVQETKEKGREE